MGKQVIQDIIFNEEYIIFIHINEEAFCRPRSDSLFVPSMKTVITISIFRTHCFVANINTVA